MVATMDADRRTTRSLVLNNLRVPLVSKKLLQTDWVDDRFNTGRPKPIIMKLTCGCWGWLVSATFLPATCNMGFSKAWRFLLFLCFRTLVFKSCKLVSKFRHHNIPDCQLDLLDCKSAPVQAKAGFTSLAKKTWGAEWFARHVALACTIRMWILESHHQIKELFRDLRYHIRFGSFSMGPFGTFHAQTPEVGEAS
jgi:hypothetical protein